MLVKTIQLFSFLLFVSACGDSAPKTEIRIKHTNTINTTPTVKKVATKTASNKTLKITNRNSTKNTTQQKHNTTKTTTTFSKKVTSKVTFKKNKPTTVGTTFSHQQFDLLLKKFVSDNGKVNYTHFKKEHHLLKKYLESLTKNQPVSSASRNEKLAYWINVYNANTIHLILENYPTKSIMDINNGKAWDKKFIKIGSEVLSLNQIENEIIRSEFNDPRIHFAVNCAAKSCPTLLNSAFLPKKLDQQLNTQTKAFINSVNNNYISANSIKISKIFDWYKSDFETNGSIIDFLNKYSDIKINPSAVIEFNNYNWNLNE